MAEITADRRVDVAGLRMGAGTPLVLIAGPCVLETEKVVMAVAERLAKLSAELGMGVIFKSSYEKDNRSQVGNYRGPGLQEGLALLAKVKAETGLPLISDVHRRSDIEAAAEVLDIVQIPAYLCQQTSLLIEAGRCAKVVNIKKGQFLAPENMSGPVGKVRHGGCQQVLLTERGTTFGYNRLVADMTSIPIMQALGCPVVFDATHIVRRYGIPSADPSGGDPEFVSVLTRAGVAAGADALFLETHPNPSEGLCDAASMLPLDELPQLLESVRPIAEAVRSNPGTAARRGTP